MPKGGPNGEPKGDANGEPKGDANGEPNGEPKGEPKGDANGEPNGEPKGDATDACVSGQKPQMIIYALSIANPFAITKKKPCSIPDEGQCKAWYSVY